MLNLEDMNDLPAGLKIKRALALRMILHDFKTKEICAVLDVSDSFVRQWKTMDENEGAEALKLH
jgi:uncharacterized protein YjcR